MSGKIETIKGVAFAALFSYGANGQDSSIPMMNILYTFFLKE